MEETEAMVEQNHLETKKAAHCDGIIEASLPEKRVFEMVVSWDVLITISGCRVAPPLIEE